MCVYIHYIILITTHPQMMCGTCMEFIVMYTFKLYIYSTEVSATCKLDVYHHCIIVTYIKISGYVSQKCMYNNKKQLTSSYSLHINHPRYTLSHVRFNVYNPSFMFMYIKIIHIYKNSTNKVSVDF